MSFYDKLYSHKKIHYVLYWLLTGVVFFVIESLLVYLFKEQNISMHQILLGTLAMVGVIIGWHTTARQFIPVMEEAKIIIHLSTENWIQQTYLDLFTFRTGLAKIVAILSSTGVIITMMVIGFPFQSIGMNIIFGIEMVLFLAICAHGAYFYFYLLGILHKLVRNPIKESFYRPDHPSIRAIYNFYSGITFTVLFLYIILIIVIWQSPYGLLSGLSIWVTILAFYPLAYFVWSYSQIHTLMYRIKQGNIDVINQQVVSILDQLKQNPSKESAEVLKQLMEIQRNLENMREWPFAFQGIFTFIAAAIPPVFQAVTSFFDLFSKP